MGNVDRGKGKRGKGKGDRGKGRKVAILKHPPSGALNRGWMHPSTRDAPGFHKPCWNFRHFSSSSGQISDPAPQEPPSASRVLENRNGTEVGNTIRQVLVEDTQKIQRRSFVLETVPVYSFKDLRRSQVHSPGNSCANSALFKKIYNNNNK